MLVWHGFQKDNLSADILCDLFDLKLPEMDRFNLEFATGNCNDAVLRRLNTLANFLAFTNVYFHTQTPRQSFGTNAPGGILYA